MLYDEKPSFSVHPAGIEPTSSEPESGILSIELRVQIMLLSEGGILPCQYHGITLQQRL